MELKMIDKSEVLTDNKSLTHLETDEKTRYSDIELQEFKKIILLKLEKARAEMHEMHSIIKTSNENGTDDTGRAFKYFEEGYDAMAKEEAGQFANRQLKFIEQLESALLRIETKNYGICQITGKLIPKERLRVVPHTIHSIEAKK